MRKFLQDKRVVGALVIGSALLAGWPVIRAQLAAHARGVVVPGVQTTESPAPAVESAAMTPPRGVSPELRDWMARQTTRVSVRDPFRRHQPGAAAVELPQSLPGLPTLQATSSQGGESLAVIDRRIVSAGIRIGEFVVEAILPGEVLLRGDGSTAIHHLFLHPPARALKTNPPTNGVVASQEPANGSGPVKRLRGTP